jgi:hypothetical protein
MLCIEHNLGEYVKTQIPVHLLNILIRFFVLTTSMGLFPLEKLCLIERIDEFRSVPRTNSGPKA